MSRFSDIYVYYIFHVMLVLTTFFVFKDYLFHTGKESRTMDIYISKSITYILNKRNGLQQNIGHTSLHNLRNVDIGEFFSFLSFFFSRIMENK